MEYSETVQLVVEGFSETDKIRMVTVNKVEDSSRMKWVKNRTDIERTDDEINGSRIRFDNIDFDVARDKS